MTNTEPPAPDPRIAVLQDYYPALDDEEALAELQAAVSRPVGVAMRLEDTERAQRAYLALAQGHTAEQAVVEAAVEWEAAYYAQPFDGLRISTANNRLRLAVAALARSTPRHG